MDNRIKDLFNQVKEMYTDLRLRDFSAPFDGLSASTLSRRMHAEDNEKFIELFEFLLKQPVRLHRRITKSLRNYKIWEKKPWEETLGEEVCPAMALAWLLEAPKARKAPEGDRTKVLGDNSLNKIKGVLTDILLDQTFEDNLAKLNQAIEAVEIMVDKDKINDRISALYEEIQAGVDRRRLNEIIKERDEIVKNLNKIRQKEDSQKGQQVPSLCQPILPEQYFEAELVSEVTEIRGT